MSTSAESLLEYRQQPLLELVHSEENYVQQLQLVRDTYMTVVNAQNFLPSTPSLTRSESCRSERPSILPKPPSSPIPSSPMHSVPAPPAELASRWRIIWGNWLQLTEWHSQFVEKLRRTVQEQPDSVPRLFLNSQSRLRSMYMKYCENYSKAVVLVAPFKTYFEELRHAFFDKNDILSRLMQPIQRVTRYQLPMIEALKLTEQAGAPESAVWRAAVIVLKNLPNDVQLMLEAAQISGFPGSVTSQGNLRLFGAMYVAPITQKDLRTAQTIAQQIIAKASGAHNSFNPQDSDHLAVKRRAISSPAFMRINCSSGSTDCHHCRLQMKRCTAAQKSINLHFMECRVFLFDQCLIIAEDNNPSPSTSSSSDNIGVSNGFQANLGRVIYGSGSLVCRSGNSTFGTNLQRPQRLCADDGSQTPTHGGRSPAIRRTVRIGRHGSHLGSLESDSSTFSGGGGNWPKLGWSAQQDPFRQSSYKFIHAIKVNRMAFAPDWLSPSMKHLDSPEVSVRFTQHPIVFNNSPTSDTSTSPSISITSTSLEHPISESAAQEDRKCTAQVNTCQCQAPDRLWFAVADEAPSSHAIFILDPFSEDAREAWLREIVDIAEMQAQLQLALQNPRRFCIVNNMRRQVKTLSSTDMTTLYSNWRCEQRNTSLSAHSSTIQLVDRSDTNANTIDQTGLSKENIPLHIRGVSAPQTEWRKQLSENQPLEGWAECDTSMECSRRLDFYASTSHESSVPDIIHTPDDVFLPNGAPIKAPQYQERDSNHLQPPAENQRGHLRRRSLSQSDADTIATASSSASICSQLARQHEIHARSSASSPRSQVDEQSSSLCPSIVATTNTVTVPTDAASNTSQKKNLMAVISSRLRRSSHGILEMLSKQTSRSASSSQACENSTQIRRRLFRVSVIDKTTISENFKPAPLPPRPPPTKISTSSSPQQNQPLSLSVTQTSATSIDDIKPHQNSGSITPQFLRRKPSTQMASGQITRSKKPQYSTRMLNRLRFSFRMSSRGESITSLEISKPGISIVSSKTPTTSAVAVNNIHATISIDGT